jgi:hypothetical protein
MLRRCLQMSPPRFGMVISSQADGGFLNEFGTMLEIRSVLMLADGRSVVATHGAYRFRIMERGIMDGYMIARVDRCVAWLLLFWFSLGLWADISRSLFFAGSMTYRPRWKAWSSARPLRTSLRIRPRCRSSRPSTAPSILRRMYPRPRTIDRRPLL